MLIDTAINAVYDAVLERIESSFSKIKNKYYSKNGETFFNPLHTAQWTIFLYEMARAIRALKTTDSIDDIDSIDYIDTCDKIYALNKMISSADIYYEVNMPNVWFCDHPQGSVMGRATYGNFFLSVKDVQLAITKVCILLSENMFPCFQIQKYLVIAM